MNNSFLEVLLILWTLVLSIWTIILAAASFRHHRQRTRLYSDRLRWLEHCARLERHQSVNGNR